MGKQAEHFTRCLLLLTFCWLLVTFCSLLVTFCSLLVTFCLLLVTFCLLLVTFCSLLVARGASRHPAFVSWATARLLVTRVSLIYLVDEFFVFSLLVLLNERRTRDESKISSCCFCIWCKSREFRDRESPRFPCVTSVVKSFSSDL